MGEDVAIDVFEVFDRRSGGGDPGQPSGPRFQGARTAFAVSVAVAVLIGLAWGVLAVFRGITSSDPAAEVCTEEQLEEQTNVSSWLGDRVSQATGTTDAALTPTGCTRSTAGQPVGATTYLVDEDDLAGAVVTLNEHECKIKLSAEKSGTCTVDIDGTIAKVTIGKTPETDTSANGDYVWSVAVQESAS